MLWATARLVSHSSDTANPAIKARSTACLCSTSNRMYSRHVMLDVSASMPSLRAASSEDFKGKSSIDSARSPSPRLCTGSDAKNALPAATSRAMGERCVTPPRCCAAWRCSRSNSSCSSCGTSCAGPEGSRGSHRWAKLEGEGSLGRGASSPCAGFGPRCCWSWASRFRRSNSSCSVCATSCEGPEGSLGSHLCTKLDFFGIVGSASSSGAAAACVVEGGRAMKNCDSEPFFAREVEPRPSPRPLRAEARGLG
jgi:hypothetical protein